MIVDGRTLSVWPQLGHALAVSVFAGICAAGTEVRAQTPAAPPAPKPSFKCGDGGSDRDTCDADTSSGVVLVHQAAEGTCVLGHTWGYDVRGVWVSGGCRGTFAVSDTRRTVDCASDAGNRQECKADTSEGVAVQSDSPSCVLGRTWGYDEDGVWASGGCQATFVLATRRSLSCASASGSREHCGADTSAGVVLVRTTGSSACVLGETWGYDATGVWVDRGCSAELLLGQSTAGGPENRDLNDFFGLFEPYGRLRGHLAAFQDELEVQNAASWLGLKFSTRGAVKFFAATEWGVNLMRGGENFVAGATTNSGFFTVEEAPAEDPFGLRLGYVGVDFGYGGRVAFGKQWGVHFDVTGYTVDRFNVFGSQAAATYTAGTDGGFLGTGRADQAVSYHNKLWIFDLGAQGQFRTANNDHLVDSAGASLQVTVLPGTRIGGTYSKAFFGEEEKQNILGLHGDAKYWAVGARFDSKPVELAFVYANQRNADLANVALPGAIGSPRTASIVFDAEGYEAYARVRFPVFSVLGGFNDYRPDVVGLLLDPNFRTRYGILGAEIGLGANTYAYVEARVFDDSIGAQGEEGFDAVTIGVHYGFSFREWHRR